VPEARFYIVGSRPGAAVRALQRRHGIVVTGSVPDVRPYLRQARVAVVPLRISQGLQNKVLEALAAGLSVVTTPEVTGGLPETARLPLFVEKGPVSMASRIVECLRAPKPSPERSAEVREILRRKYSWENNLAVLESLMRPSCDESETVARRQG